MTKPERGPTKPRNAFMPIATHRHGHAIGRAFSTKHPGSHRCENTPIRSRALNTKARRRIVARAAKLARRRNRR